MICTKTYLLRCRKATQVVTFVEDAADWNWKTKNCCTEVKSLDLVIENFRFQVSGFRSK